MSNNPLKLGVIGLGRMGRNHLRIGTLLPHVDLVGGHDIDGAAGKDSCAKHEVNFFADADELIEAVDAVVLSVPTLHHAKYAKNCLAAGKHVFVEKPMASTAADAAVILEAASNHKQVLQIGHVERYNPVFNELERILKTEKVTAIDIMRMSPFSKRAADVSVTFDLMIHDIDLVFKLTGQDKQNAPATKVHAYGLKKSSPFFDYMDCHMLLPEDRLAHLVASKITHEKIRKYMITCEGSFVVADFLAKTIDICRHQTSDYQITTPTVRYQQAALVERVFVPNIEPLYAEMLDFTTSIRRGLQPQVTGADGYLAMTMAERIEELANNG